MTAETSIPLCLDFVGTLTPINLRHERMLGAIKRTAYDGAYLPVQAEVLSWLQGQRNAGRRLVLVSDGEHQLAEQFAAHMGLFDEVAIVSNNGESTAAERKRRALVERYGVGGFDFAGGDPADLSVWEASRGAVVIGNDRLKERVAQKTQVMDTFAQPRAGLRTWIKAIRLHQWVKNALIFLPALLAHQIADPAVLFHTVVAFLAFGCCASSVYLTNDLFDLAADRQHPRKRRRPFAAGVLSVRSGIAASLGLALCAVFLSAVVGWSFAAVLAGYYVLTWSYSLRLKRVALLDVMMLAGLYTLRIIAGSAATGISLSFWLLAFSIFVFLSLGFVKRYAELYDSRKAGKLPGNARGYGADDLPLIISLGTAAGYCSVVVMAVYINSADSVALYRHHKPLWLICPVMLFWISRIWMLAARGHMHDDPVVFALRDKISLTLFALLSMIVLISI